MQIRPLGIRVFDVDPSTFFGAAVIALATDIEVRLVLRYGSESIVQFCHVLNGIFLPLALCLFIIHVNWLASGLLQGVAEAVKVFGNALRSHINIKMNFHFVRNVAKCEVR